MENSNQETSQHRCYTKFDESPRDHRITDADDHHDHTTELTQLVDKNMMHYQEYVNERANLSREDVMPYYSPTWCTILERSMLWAGGFRPSIFIRLIYALSGNEMLSHLEEHVCNGRVCSGGLGEISASQLVSINTLQVETISREEEVSKKLANLQEEIADEPIAIIARELQGYEEESREADEALDELTESMRSVLEEGDNLRLNTLKDLIRILTPIQAVDFLAAGRKLNLCVHAWGRKRDHEHGRH